MVGNIIFQSLPFQSSFQPRLRGISGPVCPQVLGMLIPRSGEDFFNSYYWTRPLGLPGWLSWREFAYNESVPHSIPGSGRSPGEGHGNPLQYSCLENPLVQKSLAGYSPWGCKESDTTKQLNTAQCNLSQKASELTVLSECPGRGHGVLLAASSHVLSYTITIIHLTELYIWSIISSHICIHFIWASVTLLVMSETIIL